MIPIKDMCIHFKISLLTDFLVTYNSEKFIGGTLDFTVLLQQFLKSFSFAFSYLILSILIY